MDRSTAMRLGIAGAVAGVGLTAGGIAVATADDKPEDSKSGTRHEGRFGDRGFHGGHGGLFGKHAEALAKELGVSGDKLRDALTSVRDDLRSEDRDDRQAKLVTALAKELGVSEAKVKAAFETLREQAEADRTERRKQARTDLSERLDEAVEDGKLTETDKASVLKAYDAEVIGGFGMHGRGGPFRR